MVACQQVEAVRRTRTFGRARRLAARAAVAVLPARAVQQLRRRVYARAARRGGGAA
jgi:hypothetical protein